ncbi:MAG TPA: hypothetical protein VJV78_05730 [Polyangiales bacterium]|nr:hypothetical protein [Polyangiales bacterium]
MSDRYARLQPSAPAPEAEPKTKAPETTADARYVDISEERLTEMREQITRQSAQAMRCEPDALQVTREDRLEWSVSSCGKFMRYECWSRSICCPYVGASRLLVTSHEPLDAVDTYDRHSLKEPTRLMQQCIERHRQADQWAAREGSNAGQLFVRLSVGAGGRVEDVTLLRTSMGEPYLEECVVDILRAATFAAREPRRFVFSYVLVEAERGTSACAPKPKVERLPR